ncbi:MAG: hypothetical protein K2X31_07020 [Sphingopyxis sp.]|nr:hypothetical protein [Sphingopyxis sp.]
MALIQAVALQFTGSESLALLVSFLLFFITGTALLGIDFIVRIANGSIRLRPIDAIKKFFPFLAIVITVMFLLSFAIGSARSVVENVVIAVFISAALSIQSTLYRKPK